MLLFLFNKKLFSSKYCILKYKKIKVSKMKYYKNVSGFRYYRKGILLQYV